MTGHSEEEATSQSLKESIEKRVSFPPDEQMVSDFVERRAELQEDIILAYKQSCEKHHVKPNPKALDQLKQITCVTDRARCFDLSGKLFNSVFIIFAIPLEKPFCFFKAKHHHKNPSVLSFHLKHSSRIQPGIPALFIFPSACERLDYCSCESLEEILKSVQFDFISLKGAELEQNGASSLLDMFLYYESATHLDMSSNSGMGFSGWLSLSHLLRQSGCLWRLDACNMPMVDYAAQALSKALLTSRLTVLHLENTCLSGKPLFTLVGALKKNVALQELYLSENNLNGYQDSMQLGDLLKYKSTLKTLDLSNNTMSDSGMPVLFEDTLCASNIMVEKVFVVKCTICFSSCVVISLGSTGLEEICDALSSQKTGLRTLILSNNHITHLGMSHLQNVLPRLKTLETLNLGKNNLENRGIHTLKESLMINRSLLQLGLASTGITCEGAVTLAEILAENPQIQRLDVRQNQVLAGGLMALSLALKINRSLIRLDLDQHLKEEKVSCQLFLILII
ncbi:protein phosphatase 1 regulatory subunit 37-like [Carassius carassius]|uniref:protein phosphatase 1 regulatory subunit 37-like n=1 Tax=Carassius carassius TaxID=217509 RepID=UPI0028683C4A|nr:protein phosphatase 1 regulatory subunit 37-like [Carassius carassius]